MGEFRQKAGYHSRTTVFSPRISPSAYSANKWKKNDTHIDNGCTLQDAQIQTRHRGLKDEATKDTKVRTFENLDDGH
ncbi:unnamed protein product [Schistosoma curassoni]|uniref:Uncharacterized protein n=1 Tax=Schistosoma curassoni TaxID=6186 RepID=A0A183KNV3_9TREM|nr:unnamed protein product [Schistosoma curassoni]